MPLKECSSVCSFLLWTEVKSERFITIPLGRHADPPLGSQPNADTHQPSVSLPVRLNRKPCCSKENTEPRCTEEGIRGRAVRKERGCYLLFTLHGSELNGSFSPADENRLWNVIWDAGRGLLEKGWAFLGRRIKEQYQICCSVISPIDHCLLGSAREPPGCKLQYQLWPELKATL